MIPKVIHYCWFGGNPLPKSARVCIDSWKKFFPDFQIREWNETNYNVNKNSYISQAYAAKKFAFVSDYARLDILYHEGGVYFDTDVEVIKPFDDILMEGAFFGCEKDGKENGNLKSDENVQISINPGLGIAVTPGHEFYKELLDLYDGLKFINDEGTMNTTTIVDYTTNLLIEKGMKDVAGIQNVAGITIYPKVYFNPYDWRTGKIYVTPETYSIHNYAGSWTTKRNKINKKMYHMLSRISDKLK